MSELLRCEGVTKNFGSVRALNKVDLSLESGKIIGLLGPNGSGKTTLIKLINGLLQPDEGRILIEGEVPGVESKRKVAYLPDKSFLNSWMKVSDIVEMFAEFYDDFRMDRAYEMLSQLDVDKDVRLKTLSKGNQEKVCLILVMSRSAKLYVLDEPIAGVDPATRDYIISTIINNYNPEASVLISTHLISDIENVLDDVIFIQNGEITLHKSTDEIREEHHESVDALFREVFRW